jgi:hypothetical protein
MRACKPAADVKLDGRCKVAMKSELASVSKFNG